MAKKKDLKKRKKDGLKRSEKIELAAAIREAMVEGSSDGDIIEELGITAQDFAVAKKFLLESIGNEQELMTSRERFAEYLLRQDRNIAELDDLVTNLNSKTQYNVILGAIRLRADIGDRVIATGQTLGVIDREPEKKIMLGGIAVSELPDKGLRKGVIAAIAGFGKLIEKYGEGMSLKQLQPGTLHYGEAVELSADADKDTAALGAPPIKEPSKDKRNRAKSSKRTAGRRRVKESKKKG